MRKNRTTLLRKRMRITQVWTSLYLISSTEGIKYWRYWMKCYTLDRVYQYLKWVLKCAQGRLSSTSAQRGTCLHKKYAGRTSKAFPPLQPIKLSRKQSYKEIFSVTLSYTRFEALTLTEKVTRLLKMLTNELGVNLWDRQLCCCHLIVTIVLSFKW